MSEVSEALQDLVKHKTGMDSKELLVALYETYRRYKSLFRMTASSRMQLVQYFKKIEEMFSNRGLSVHVNPFFVPPEYWRIFIPAPANEYCFVLASLEVLSVQVCQHIAMDKRRFGDRAESPISGTAYLLILRQETPWTSGTPRYNKPGERWLKEIHIVPEWDGFQKKFFQLPRDLLTRMDHAIQKIPPLEGHRSVPVARMAVWPIHRNLSFAVKRSPPLAVEPPDTGHYVSFHLKDNNKAKNWREKAKHFRESILPRCQEECVLVLVLPELSVPPKFLSLLQSALQDHFETQKKRASERGFLGAPPCYPILTVAGSFHVSNGTCTLEAVNRTVVLDYRGEEVAFKSNMAGGDPSPWTMEKLARYTIRRSHLPDEASGLIHELGLNDAKVDFAAEPGRLGTVLPIVYAGPRLGMMTTVICIDFLEGVRSWLDQFQGKGWVDWLFVPSASTETAPFARSSKEWSEKGVCTVVVNACWLLEQAKKWPGASFAQAGIPQGAPLSRGSNRPQKKRYARWRQDHFETKAGDYALPPPSQPYGTGGCTRSCGECLAILDLELDEGSPRTLK